MSRCDTRNSLNNIVIQQKYVSKALINFNKMYKNTDKVYVCLPLNTIVSNQILVCFFFKNMKCHRHFITSMLLEAATLGAASSTLLAMLLLAWERLRLLMQTMSLHEHIS